MSTRYRLLLAIGFLLLAYGGLHLFVQKKIHSILEKQKTENQISFSKMKLNLLRRSLRLDSVSYKKDGITITANSGGVSGVGLGSYIFNQQISIREIRVENPQIVIQKSKDSESTTDSSTTVKNPISIRSIRLVEGALSMVNEEEVELKISNFDVDLSNLKIDDKTLAQTLPFTYEDYQIKGEELTYQLNSLQTLNVKQFELDTTRAVFSPVQLQPRYSREEYVKVIPYEKDLMDIAIEQVELKSYRFSLEDSGQLIAEKLLLRDTEANIYRDKLVQDDPHDKKLYSQMLRELDFQMKIDSLQIENASVIYEEVQENTGETGVVFFKNMNAVGTNITNINKEDTDFPTTRFDIQTLFMGEAPFHVEWSFKVNDPEDRFRIVGKSQHISPEAANNFFIPGMQMKAEGEEIKELNFDFTGNHTVANGTFQMIYEDLKIIVLRKDGKEKNTIISAIANLFVSHKATANEEALELEDIERDKKRSFWNYLWTGVFTGVKKTMLP